MSAKPTTSEPKLYTEEERTLRAALWVPCETKEALGRWVRIFLGVDLPDGHVDITSNSSPLEVLWEVYSKALANNDPDFQRIMAYASRLSFKTLSAAILEVLCLMHLDRDVIHMAAIKEQSEKCQEYVHKFFNRPFLRDFVESKSSTYMSICRYVHEKTGEVLSPREYKALLDVQKSFYEAFIGYIDITSCTMAGTNSKHAAMMVVDEVDVIEGEKVKAYEQAKLIPDRQRGKIPMTLLISTRKTNFGKVQAEIDEAQKTGLVIRHWNVIDVAEPCPTSRHQPEMPRIVLYRNEKTLQVLSEEDFERLDENRQKDFEAREAFWGCQHNCRLFGPCEGRLATINPHRNAGTLKDLGIVTTQFRNVSVEMALSELLCRKPGTEGLIYPSLDPTIHLMSAAEMASLLTGENVSEPFQQEQLVQVMLSRGMRPVAGMDFGYSHNFSLVLGFTDGNRIYVVDAYSQAELMPDAQTAKALQYLRPTDAKGNPIFSARIYPDMENSQMIDVLKHNGLHMVKWSKGPGTVLAGIESVRVSLSAIVGHPRLLFLRGNERVEFFFKRMSAYNWKLDAAGRPSDIPNEENDDECDATRYLVMNTLGKYSGFVMAPDAGVDGSSDTTAVNRHSQVVGMPGKPAPSSVSVVTPEVARQMNWNAIAGMVGIPSIDMSQGTSSDGKSGHKGTFSWNL